MLIESANFSLSMIREGSESGQFKDKLNKFVGHNSYGGKCD